jgi:hypothetical protein
MFAERPLQRAGQPNICLNRVNLLVMSRGRPCMWPDKSIMVRRAAHNAPRAVVFDDGGGGFATCWSGIAAHHASSHLFQPESFVGHEHAGYRRFGTNACPTPCSQLLRSWQVWHERALMQHRARWFADGFADQLILHRASTTAHSAKTTAAWVAA